jgi:hypothetical protein
MQKNIWTALHEGGSVIAFMIFIGSLLLGLRGMFIGALVGIVVWAAAFVLNRLLTGRWF